MTVTLIHGDAKLQLKTLSENSIDAVITDAPYELGFQSKKWDSTGIAYDVEFWKEVYRVLKPGAHLVCFGGSRTYHRMACAVEDAGFEIRDQLQWLYGGGYPKGMNISKAFDKAAGVTGDVIGHGKGRTGESASPHGGSLLSDDNYLWPGEYDIHAPATDNAKEWEGWSTALKPAHEPIVLARKPLIGKVIDNIVEYGTGGLNIDACRINSPKASQSKSSSTPIGRWPANIMLDDDAANMLDQQSGVIKTNRIEKPSDCDTGGSVFTNQTFQGKRGARGYSDTGGASRFFYCAKASRKERELGLDNMAQHTVSSGCGGDFSVDDQGKLRDRFKVKAANIHPTVKPIAVMQWLVRLITPPNGVVLDPFMGSGTTGMAACLEDKSFIGIERDETYMQIAEQRIQYINERT